ncbi:hypothetical protein GTA08_BOTSDO01886 [Neofusicoccum parvum]|uniref:Uncharacterized protein n=1 Tax=Neofusicoccum parvum TaxID=310453 RepID=A0ACB5SJC7_9PEZI|nr:hypothetical protein GTA08_BOTSDO01886 [Neofusicoccum parvum]GME48667.1 hypothetical protein GTA08_BOTSDO01886 [Neofusicoccum parvum]
MRLKDVEAWVEDSLHAQEKYGMTPSSPLDTAATSTRHWPTKPDSGEWPSLDHAYTVQEAIPELEGDPLQRTKSSSFSSSTRKKLAKSPSDLVNWFKSPSLPGSGPRSRSTSQTTEPSEEEQAAFDQRWSTSSRRRLIRLSDSSQRALLTSGTPPTYRSVLNGFHRRFYSTSGNSESSDSSWTSFGCIDGMRRPGAGMKAAKNVDEDKIDECEEQGNQPTYPVDDMDSVKGIDPEKADRTVKDGCSIKEASPVKKASPVKDANSPGKASTAKKAGQAKESRPVKEALKRFASRLEVPIRPPRQYLESDTACMMPYY